MDQLAQHLAPVNIKFQQTDSIMAMILKSASVEPFVIRLLRCRHTRRYFKAGGWTEDPSDATRFAAEIDVVRACVVNNLRDVELVLSAPGTYLDLLIARIR